MKKNLLITILVIVIVTLLSLLAYKTAGHNNISVNSFDDCVSLTGKVLESFPRQCNYKGQMFTEVIPEVEIKPKAPITVNLAQYSTVTSPLTIVGSAPGNWFFEAQFNVEIKNSSGVVGTGLVTTTDDWMTTNMINFTTNLTFPPQTPGTQGQIIFHKSNPSGEAQNDESYSLPIQF